MKAWGRGKLKKEIVEERNNMQRVLSYHPWCPPFAMAKQMFNSMHQRSDFPQTLNEFLQDPKSIQMHRVLWYVGDCISCVWPKKKVMQQTAALCYKPNQKKVMKLEKEDLLFFHCVSVISYLVPLSANSNKLQFPQLILIQTKLQHSKFIELRNQQPTKRLTTEAQSKSIKTFSYR